MGPENGPIFGRQKRSRSEPRRTQAATFLQWAQWLKQSVFAGSEVVIVNLDETSIERTIPRMRGHVLRQQGRGASWHERIARRESHGHLTLVACIVDDVELQRSTPQLLLTKDDALSLAEKDLLRALQPPVVWVEGTAGWVTGANFPQVLTLLRRAYRAQRPNAALVIVLDSASQHLSAPVLAHAARLGVHLIFVPAGLTWLLQPLDTHVFALLKRRLGARQARERAAHPSGALPPGRWVALLEEVIQTSSSGGRGPRRSPPGQRRNRRGHAPGESTVTERAAIGREVAGSAPAAGPGTHRSSPPRRLGPTPSRAAERPCPPSTLPVSPPQAPAPRRSPAPMTARIHACVRCVASCTGHDPWSAGWTGRAGRERAGPGWNRMRQVSGVGTRGCSCSCCE